MSKHRRRYSLLCAAVMLVSLAAFAPPAQAQYTDVPAVGQLRVNCGAVDTFVPETYLTAESGSAGAQETLISSTGGGHYTFKRQAGDGGYFVYTLPVSAAAPAPLRLSLQLTGDAKVVVEGQTLFAAPAAGLSGILSKDYTLSDAALWSDGALTVRFEDANPGNGKNFGVYWLELGATSPFEERVKHILWDTSAVVWNVGVYDGYTTEFRGSASDFTLGGDVSSLASTGTVKLRWNAAPSPNKQYWLLTGLIGGSGLNTIDMGDDGTLELSRGANLEKIHDLNVTDLLKAGDNVVKITMGTGTRLDFAALVEVTPGTVKDDDLRVVFKGGQMASDWTKLVNNTMYFNDELFVDKSSGFIDASPPNGIFYGGYWVADAAPMALEIAKWGYFDMAKQASAYRTASTYVTDNGAGGLMFSAIAYLMKSDNYQGDYTTKMYPTLKAGMDYYVAQMDNNPLHMIKGNNWETTNGDYGAYNNSIACFALLAASDAARRTGHTADADKWAAYAETLKTAITNNLITTQNMDWLGRKLPAGTVKFGVNASGNLGTGFAAGWFGIGRQEELYYGYKGDAVPAWRAAVQNTLKHHSGNFWNGWELYGHNQGFGTSYGVMSERGGWPLSAMFMSDMMDMAKKNLEHVIYNSVDYYFENDNEGVAEISPYVIVREISEDDHGITGAKVGNGGVVEDMNLVEHAVTMTNVRYMAGVDDSLAGDSNLKIIPRIPRDWTGVKVNQWPALYKDGANYKRANISYDYDLSPVRGRISLRADQAIPGVEVRLGPFEKSATVANVSLNGSPLASSAYRTEMSGDSQWVWATLPSVGLTGAVLDVRVSLPGVNYYNDYETETQGVLRLNNDFSWMPLTVIDFAGGAAASVDVTMLEKAAASLRFGMRNGAVGGYALTLNKNAGREGALQLVDRETGAVIWQTDMNVTLNREYQLKVITKGDAIMIFLSGTRVGVVNGRTFTGNFAGMEANGPSLFDNITVYSDSNVDMPAITSISIMLGSQSSQAKILTSYPMSATARYEFSDGTSLPSASASLNVEFKSSDESVIAMDGSKLMVKRPGTAEIWAQTAGGAITSNRIDVTAEDWERGNIVFSDDFSEPVLKNWVKNGGTFAVSDGAMVSTQSGDAWNIFGATAKDFTFSGDITLVSGNAVGLSFRTNNNGTQGYDIIMDIMDGGIKFCRRPYSVIKSLPLPFDYNKSYHVTVVAKGADFKFFLDGVLVFEASNTARTSGQFGVFGYTSTARFDNLICYTDSPLSTLSLTAAKTELFVPLGSGLTVTGKAADGSDLKIDTGKIQYELNTPDFLTLSGHTVTAKAEGTTVITAKTTEGAPLTSNAVQVKSYVVDDLLLSTSKPTAMVGESAEAVLKTTAADGTQLALPTDGSFNYVYHSSKPDVAEIVNGNIIRKARGKADLWATLEVGGATLTSNKITILSYVMSEGDVLFRDDFDDGDLAGWAFNKGTWKNLDQNMNGVGSGDTWGLYQDVTASDFIFSTKAVLNAGASVGVSFRMTNQGANYFGYDAILDTNNSWLVVCKRNPGYVPLATQKLTITRGKVYDFTVIASGPNIKVLLDGVQILEVNDAQYPTGKFGVFNYSGTTTYDDMVAYGLQTFAESVTVARADGKDHITTVGAVLPLTATVLPDNTTNKTVTWSVTDPGGQPTDRATIGADGVLHVVKSGPVVVKAVSNDPTQTEGTLALEIRGTVLKTGTASVIMLKRGRTMTLPIETDTYGPLVITSLNQSVATVTDTGEITGLKAGMTNIRILATDGSGLMAQVVVNVVS